MITGNKCEVFAVVNPEEWDSAESMDTFVRGGMAAELAHDLVKYVPVRVSIELLDMWGGAKEEHKMTLFVFSEEEMEEHDAYIKKTTMYALAADRCLHTLPEVVCH